MRGTTQARWVGLVGGAFVALLAIACECRNGPKTRCDDVPTISEEAAREAAIAFLADPDLPPSLELTGAGDSLDDSVYPFRVARDGSPDSESPPASGSLSVRRRDGKVVHFRMSEAFAWFPEGTCAPDVARALAESFVRRHHPELWSVGHVEVTMVPSSIDFRDGTYTVRLRRREEGFLTLSSAYVRVRAYDGRIAEYAHGDKPYTIPRQTIDMAEATRAAIRASGTQGRIAEDDLHVQSTSLGFTYYPGDVEGTPVWVMRLLEGHIPAGQGARRRATAYVHAVTGDVQEVIWGSEEPDEGREAAEPSLCDSWPVWAPDGRSVVCVSDRSREGYPHWRTRNRTLFSVELATARMGCLYQALDEHHYDHPTWCGADWIIFESLGMWALSLRTGEAIEVMPQSRNGQVPHGLADGTLLAFSAYRRHGDQDVFTVPVIVADGKLSLGRQLRCARTPGVDGMPILSDDGQWVYYAHLEAPPADQTERPATELRRARTGIPDWENEAPETILTGLGRVRRMSCFPDGDRLLLWHDAGLDVVDVVAKTQTSLDLPDLQDPDMAEAPPLKVREPVLSPDGQRLAFSGLLESGDDRSGWYIYTCRLDGADLERVTPLGNAPVASYRFPDSGRTSFEIAKEDILARWRSEQE